MNYKVKHVLYKTRIETKVHIGDWGDCCRVDNLISNFIYKICACNVCSTWKELLCIHFSNIYRNLKTTKMAGQQTRHIDSLLHKPNPAQTGQVCIHPNLEPCDPNIGVFDQR